MISIAGMFYFTLENFSPARRSKLSNIYITSIVKTSLLKKYSVNKILEHLVKDLLQLVRLYYNETPTVCGLAADNNNKLYIETMIFL